MTRHLIWGNHVLSNSTPCDLLVVDELGPLEIDRGTGWQAGLAAVDSKEYAVAVVVVRAELLGRILRPLGRCQPGRDRYPGRQRE